MKPVEIIQVIRTAIVCRGNGTPRDPNRIVTQFWSVDGDLLAEVDPVARSVTPKEMLSIFNTLHPDPDVAFSRERIMVAMFGEQQP